MYAATPTTLTCSDSPYGTPNFTINVYSLLVSQMHTGTSYFSVYTDVSNFESLSLTEVYGTYADCQISGSGGYLESVTLEDVSLSATGGQESLQATFSFSSLLFPNPGTAKAPASAVKTPLTAEEKAKSLAAFEARVPAPSATQGK